MLDVVHKVVLYLANPSQPWQNQGHTLLTRKENLIYLGSQMIDYAHDCK